MSRHIPVVIALILLSAILSVRAHAQCIGDCSKDGKVTPDEVLTLVGLALDGAQPTACALGDIDDDQRITVDEILAAVNTALSALRLTASGTCMRPGQAQSLVPCGDSTPVSAFRCEDTTRCLHDPSALTVLAVGMVKNGVFSLASCTPPGAPLVFAASVDSQSETDYRIIDFGFVGAGGSASLAQFSPSERDLTLQGIQLNPVSEAGVRVLDENGLEHFDAIGASAVVDAVETANAQTQFTGQDPAAAATLATDTASNDPVVQATIIDNRQGNPLAIQVLGAGPAATAPAPGVRVIRHDPSSGAVLADVLTDQNGVANFGDIGSDHTTISIVSQRKRLLFTFVNLPVGSFPPASPFRFNNVDLVDRTTVATVDVTLTNLPMGIGQVQLFGGASEGQSNPIGGSSADIPNFTVQQLQSDGKISFLALAVDSTGVIRSCGSSVDRDVAAVNNQTLAIATNTTPMAISFTASAPVVTNGAQILRKGVIFDLFNGGGGSQDPVTFGTFNFCPISGADGFALSLVAPETASTAARAISKISAVLPTSLDVTVPSLSIDNLVRSADGRTISWTRSGSDIGKLDFVSTRLDWRSGGIDYQWELVGDPAPPTSVTLPALPGDLSDRVPPPNGVGIRVQVGGLDNLNGFEDLGQKLSTAGTDFSVFQFAATEFIQAERTRPVLTVAKDGPGSGTVRSSPVGIDCGVTCAANFGPGSGVTLTAVPDTGSTFAGWSGDCGGGSSQISVTMHDNLSCTATFAR